MNKLATLSCVMLTLTTFAQQTDPNSTLDTLKRIDQQTQENAAEIKLLKQFKFSGYIQTQFQYGQKDASLKVGGGNTNEKDFYRFGIRRGRIKLEYEHKIISSVFQLDITEKGIGLKDAYLSIKDPWFGTNSIKVGVFNRPFGYEIAYSSTKRAAPERATILTTLFPDERDLGAMLTLQASKKSPWNILKLEVAAIGGNGIKLDLDNRKDVITRLSVAKNFNDKITLGAGVSYYNGGTYQGSENNYKMVGNSFVKDSDSSYKGKFAKREYLGVEFQLNTASVLGLTQLYGEFILGNQPGNKNDSKSPNYSTIPTADTYIRSFRGGYVTLIQDLGSIPLSLITKYEYYDPNVKVSKNDIGLNDTGKADILYQTFGFGLMWRINNHLRATAYYDWTINEKSSNLIHFNKEIKDNVFTFRLQYKF
jgi:phosphate-selective porin